MSWPMVSIKSVAKVTTGKTPSKKVEEYFGGHIPFISPAELGNGQFVSPAKQTLTEAGAAQIKLVPKNSVLVCCIGSLGKLAIADQTLGTNQQINSVTFDEKLVFPKYGYYALSRLKPILESIAPATTVAIVSKSKFEELEIPLPPLDEQKRIAAILDKADAIRQKRKHAIALADEFLRSVFLEMFGDPMSNPKGWEVKPLGSMILKGPTNGLYKPSSSYGSGCRILRIDGFYDGELVGEDKLKRVELSEDELVKYLLPARSVVINRVNSPEYLGKCAFVENLSESTVFESNMMNFIVDENLINPRFLVMQLQMPNIKKQIQTRAKHAVNQSSINQQDVKGFDLLVPPINIQNKYESIVEALKKNRNALVDHQDKSFGLFSSLSQKAFSGQL